jgi:hypothetical protein
MEDVSQGRKEGNAKNRCHRRTKIKKTIWLNKILPTPNPLYHTQRGKKRNTKCAYIFCEIVGILCV